MTLSARSIVENLLDDTHKGITPKEFMDKMGIVNCESGHTPKPATYAYDASQALWSCVDLPGNGGLPRLFGDSDGYWVRWNVRMKHHNVGMFTIEVTIHCDGAIELDLEDERRFSRNQGPYDETDMAKVEHFKNELYKFCGARGPTKPYDPFDL